MSFATDLRASVLQAAMQGKLTKQLDTDTPVSKLIDEINSQKKKGVTHSDIDDIPEVWDCVKLADVATLYTGNSISESVKTSRYTGLKEGFNYIGTKDVNYNHTIVYNNGVKIPFNETNFRYAFPGATLLCIEGGSAGRKIAIVNEKVCFGNKLCSFHPIGVDSLFLYYYLQSPQFLNVFTNNISGIIGGVSINKLKQMDFPVPPIEEQKRIVQRIEEIMRHIDELEAIEEELKKLKEAFPDDMKASVLQAAIQGKLTEQLDTDSPVDELLENIAEERENLIKEGKIKKSKKTNDSIINDVPFDIPSGWKWVKLNSIAYTNGGYAFQSSKYSEDGVRVVRISDFSNDGLLFNQIIRHPFSKDLEQYVIQTNDILMCMTGGTVGKCCLINNLPEKMVTNQRVANISSISVLPNFLHYVLKSCIIQDIINQGKNSTNDNISMDLILSFPIPLPPLEEQQRIVDKLETILPLLEYI